MDYCEESGATDHIFTGFEIFLLYCAFGDYRNNLVISKLTGKQQKNGPVEYYHTFSLPGTWLTLIYQPYQKSALLFPS